MLNQAVTKPVQALIVDFHLIGRYDGYFAEVVDSYI